jgi:hypothetical protein
MQRPLSKGGMSNLFKDKERLLKVAGTKTSQHVLSMKTKHAPEFLELENQFWAWFRRNETKHAAITEDLLKMKALRLSAELKLVDFRASDGWIRNFKKRHGIGEVVLHGEAGSADQVYAEIAEVGLPKILQGADSNDIYNVDETEWNYRSIPKRTLTSQPRGGIKEAKDRVTAVLCRDPQV